ncbi:ADP-ribosyl cyclase/cyclic ADP-ribose hydrolase 1-like [Patiria miniata]|uniref:ADP-ribosyl cyclase/cyclic ADP-ribose hydrolase n=1 Tax=Patiria miniata TaxID=46514 RepID=A0A913ZG48_PATMI|nr:ADP-ribosyl cyclase/cyclic ADP-ribose hydrolase 1-like [Patiria miniata]
MTMRSKLFLPNLVGLLVLACLAAPTCRGESLANVLKRVDDEDFAARVNGNRVAGAGTTLNIREIVIGRCWDYQRVTGMNQGRPLIEVICGTTAWPAFVNAFAFQNPCNVREDAFRSFTNIMTVSLPRNGTIFWSGTKNLAKMYSELSGGTMFSLETTFVGYTVNDLTWCGTPLGAGINYASCPSFDDPSCPSQASTVFWGSASKLFARQARGSVSVLLNGSDSRGAFRNNSVFSTVELPNLDSSLVDFVNIIVVHDLDGQIVDTCDSGTILILKDRIIKRGMKWTCEDDPKLAKLIQCTEKPDYHRCNLASRVHSRSWNFVVLTVLASFWITGTG